MTSFLIVLLAAWAPGALARHDSTFPRTVVPPCELVLADGVTSGVGAIDLIRHAGEWAVYAKNTAVDPSDRGAYENWIRRRKLALSDRRTARKLQSQREQQRLAEREIELNARLQKLLPSSVEARPSLPLEIARTQLIDAGGKYGSTYRRARTKLFEAQSALQKALVAAQRAPDDAAAQVALEDAEEHYLDTVRVQDDLYGLGPVLYEPLDENSFEASLTRLIKTGVIDDTDRDLLRKQKNSLQFSQELKELRTEYSRLRRADAETIDNEGAEGRSLEKLERVFLASMENPDRLGFRVALRLVRGEKKNDWAFGDGRLVRPSSEISASLSAVGLAAKAAVQQKQAPFIVVGEKSEQGFFATFSDDWRFAASPVTGVDCR